MRKKQFISLSTLIATMVASLVLLSCSTPQGDTNPDVDTQQPGAAESELEYIGNELCLDCHDDPGALVGSSHWLANDPRSPGAHDTGCEACHGPGQMHLDTFGEIDVPGMVTFGDNANVPAEQQNKMCLNCHQAEVRHWHGSEHDSDELACTDCHTLLHGDQTQRKLQESTFCYECHQNVRAETYRPFRHPIREELLHCVDCHSPHGSPGPAMLKQLSVNDNCYSCHAEKRGPYLWEHESVVEECSSCHLAHGSLHPALLSSRPPLLCQQCHQSTRINHARQAFYFGKPPVEHTSGGGSGLRTGPDQFRLGNDGSGQSGGGRDDSRTGFGPGDGTGTGEGGSGYGDGSHDDGDHGDGGDQDQDQDHAQDQHHDQDRVGPGGADNIVQGGSSRFLLGTSCLGCHSQVHGSNHPSGVNLMR